MECNPIMKKGRCIAGDVEVTDLRVCKGCEHHFVKDMAQSGFSGIIFRSDGKKQILQAKAQA